MIVPASYHRNIAQRGDALALLRSLPNGCSPLGFFDPQHRGVLDKLAFGNEGARQQGRAQLPAMTEDFIDAVCRESARVLTPKGYLLRWVDTYGLCEGHHRRVAGLLSEADCPSVISHGSLFTCPFSSPAAPATSAATSFASSASAMNR